MLTLQSISYFHRIAHGRMLRTYGLLSSHMNRHDYPAFTEVKFRKVHRIKQIEKAQRASHSQTDLNLRMIGRSGGTTEATKDKVCEQRRSPKNDWHPQM